MGFSCIDNLNCINFLTTTGQRIYEAVNSAVNLLCWNENHYFCCFVLNKLSSFLLYSYPAQGDCCGAGYSPCLSYPVQQLFSQILGAKFLSSIWKSLLSSIMCSYLYGSWVSFYKINNKYVGWKYQLRRFSIPVYVGTLQNINWNWIIEGFSLSFAVIK